MSTVTDPADIKLLKLLQVEMPVVERPFAALADRVGASEKEVLERVQRLKANGVIRQISAIFDTRSLGYESSLVAARFEPARVDEAAAVINRHPGVSHNYLRNHSFNLWFTIAVAPTSKLGLQRTLEILQNESGASALRPLPTLKLYKIGVQFDLGDESKPDESAPPQYTEGRRVATIALNAADIEFVRIMQRDVSLTPTPFVEYARELGVSLGTLQRTYNRFLEQGTLRRFAAVLHHRKAGFSANAMGVWLVPGDDAEVDRVGEILAGFRAVTHCYRRPAYPDWPYNIFTMVHGKTAADCEKALRAMSEKTGVTDYAALYSTKEYKKSRIRYFTHEEEEWEHRYL
jgi:DNA-binding Lrp family transcriptional regulator